MKIQKILLGLGFVFIAGCVPSLHELYTKKTLVYDDTLAGKFTEDKQLWEFVGDAEHKSYAVTITEEKGKKSKLTGHLVEAGGVRFFDFYPAETAELEGGDWLKFHIIPVHLFFKVDKTADGFSLSAMNPDKVDELLKEKPAMVKHERVEDSRVILTDLPKNLQTFLLEGVKIEDFFGDPVELVPVKMN